MRKLVKDIHYKTDNDPFLCFECNINKFEYWNNYKQKNFNMKFENGIEISKKELMLNKEIKKHKELRGMFLSGYGNMNLINIHGHWIPLKTIQNIIPERFIIYDFIDGFMKISNLDKTEFAIICSYKFV